MRTISSLRRAYFAAAGEIAGRYGISFDRIVEHLWQARRFSRRLALHSIGHVEDLVHAIACIDNVGQAWADLAERYEPSLVRACRGKLGDIEGILFVRRLLADLRHRQATAPSAHHPSLRGYIGVRPLRNWLADRLSVGLSREIRASIGANGGAMVSHGGAGWSIRPKHGLLFNGERVALTEPRRVASPRIVAGTGRAEVANWPYEPAREM